MKAKAGPARGPLLPIPLCDPPPEKPQTPPQRVAIALLRRGYAIVDDARIPLFGGLRFETPGEAEVFLEHANLRTRGVRWKLCRPAARRRRRIPVQLSLF